MDDLPSGAYVFHRDLKALELLKEGDYRRQAGHLGLDQPLPADASVDFFFMTNLNPILERFGNRGYRLAQLDASITAGKNLPGSLCPKTGGLWPDVLRRPSIRILLAPRGR